MLPWKWKVILWFDRQLNWSPGNSSIVHTRWWRSRNIPIMPSWTTFHAVKTVNSTSIDQIVTTFWCDWSNRKGRSPNGCVDHDRTIGVNYSDNQSFGAHLKSSQNQLFCTASESFCITNSIQPAVIHSAWVHVASQGVWWIGDGSLTWYRPVLSWMKKPVERVRQSSVMKSRTQSGKNWWDALAKHIWKSSAMVRVCPTTRR
jgi:hypothetical protein